MSYYTEVRLEQWGDESVTNDILLAEARAYLEGCDGYAADDIMEDLTKGFKSGSTSFSDLRSADLTPLFRALSKKFPKVTLRIWGHGEEPKDVWTREFLGGKITFKRGPFDKS